MRGLFARLAWAAFQPRVMETRPGWLVLQFPPAARLDQLGEAHSELLAEAIALPAGIQRASVTARGCVTIAYDPLQIGQREVLAYLQVLGEVVFESYATLKDVPVDEIRQRMQALDSKRPTADELRALLRAK
jgi:hypothetical protein